MANERADAKIIKLFHAFDVGTKNKLHDTIERTHDHGRSMNLRQNKQRKETVITHRARGSRRATMPSRRLNHRPWICRLDGRLQLPLGFRLPLLV